MLCELVSKTQLRPGLFDFQIESPQMAENAKPGQFIHVLCGGNSYLRRPISICDVINGRYIRFIFEIRGEGTKNLAHANIGELLDVLGPLGNGFDISFDRQIIDGDIILIGGGIGIFPLMNLAKRLPKKPLVMLGFRNKQNAVLTEEFAKISGEVFVASDDGSVGRKGFVTDLLKNHIASGNKVARIYTCGPKIMMKTVVELAAQNNIECSVSMEERMGCGVGACVTCTCTMTDGSRKRVCKDGPVFDGAEVDFDG